MRAVLLPSAYAPSVGGVEELTHRLAGELQRSGDEVEVWTNRHPVERAPEETIEGVRVRRFPLPLPLRRPAALAAFPFRAGGSLRAMAGAARRFEPDVLHVQCFSSNGVYATALSRLLRIPLVVSLQGETVMDDHDVYEHSPVLRAGLRAGIRRAAVVTGCSRFVLADAEGRFGLAPGAGRVVFNGVDLQGSDELVPVPIPFERYVFGVGRFVEKKGFDLLLESFARLASRHPDVGLVIGGDGAARAAVAARVGELGLASRVLLPGTLSRGQVAGAMANAAVFVLPSRVEPFGIVVLEALRAGTPVVVSARGGAPEFVRDGEHGLVADPLDTDALAQSIGRLLDDRALADRLGAAGRERVRDFGWERIAEQYRAIYAEVVAAPSPSSSSSS